MARQLATAISFPSQIYDAPWGAVWKHFLDTLTDLLEGIYDRRWNSERFIVFQMVILHFSQNSMKEAEDKRKRMSRRMEAWAEGKFNKVAQDI